MKKLDDGLAEHEDEYDPGWDGRSLDGRYPDYPPALLKACADPFDYALGLRDGTVFRFTEAEPINTKWVHLKEVREHHHPHFEGEYSDGVSWPKARGNGLILYSFERGLDLRVSEIAWVADAPQGS